MTSADRFISGLLVQCRGAGPLRRVRTGMALLRAVWHNYRLGSEAARNLPVDGFKPELTAHNQRGQLLRHLRLHAGLTLLGPPGRLASWAADALDQHQADSGRLESHTEVRDNQAGRRCGEILGSHLRGVLSPDEARTLLAGVLCEDPAAPRPGA
ncbi:MAG: hypothetical protein HKN82_17125 [Akkermansiaceae bacterium]|nr:hypothetical protein [Akkermansiaceae bacterium]